MENFIDYIHINNFKSVRDLKLEGLSRINLFIGKPNVGKSNILEAFGIFSLPYLKYNSNKNISSIVRVESETELFFDGNKDKNIEIETNQAICSISIEDRNFLGLDLGVNSIGHATINHKNLSIKFVVGNSKTQYFVDEKLKFSYASTLKNNTHFISALKKYDFTPNAIHKKIKFNLLLPPNGINIFSTIEKNVSLKNQVKNLFSDYNLNLVFDKASQEFKIMKTQKNDEIFLIPYGSIADTLQRVIFYKTAIASNQNSVLIFEEPEAHAFPPYISHITQEIIESKSNQFILSTHSPYVLNDFLENAREELSIFMVDYKNGETVVNKLTKEDLDDIYGYGIDLFTNYETFIK